MKRVAPSRSDECVARPVAPFPRILGRKAQSELLGPWESCPRIEPQLVGSADLSPCDHDLPRVGRRDCPERFVVVPAVVSHGIHRVPHDAIAGAKADEHRAFPIGESDRAHVGPRLRSTLDRTRRLASLRDCAESWLLATGSFPLTSPNKES